MRWLAVLLCGWGLASAQLQPPAAPASAAPVALARDLREEVEPLLVTLRDMNGREETRSIPLTWYRPPGDGPFPLAILSHGRDPAPRRAQVPRLRFERLARYLVGKGFAVAVPTRVGYGTTFGDFDPESGGRCDSLTLQPMAQVTSAQVLATLERARQKRWVDASRWVAIGQSVGGVATVALAGLRPPGLVAAINFSGGAGGNPDRNPGRPCSPQAFERVIGEAAATAQVPMLWVYWSNDNFWGTELPQRWAQAWRDAGGALEFHQLPPSGTEGHNGLNQAMDAWVPLVEHYLASAGFKQSGVPQRPPATDFARLDEVNKVPVKTEKSLELYRRFLAAAPPRAFAIGPAGAAFSRGDWAIGNALGFCQARRGLPCRLYAVDNDVVWTPPP